MLERSVMRAVVTVWAVVFGFWIVSQIGPMYRNLAVTMTAVAATSAPGHVGRLACIGGEHGNGLCLLQRD
jgi:hypothetical protein